MALSGRPCLQFWGLPGMPADATLALNAAATQIAYGFVPGYSKTVNELRFYFSAAAGSLAAADTVAFIRTPASGGNPGTEVATAAGATAVTGAGWVDFTGFSYAVTAGSKVFFGVKNVNANPGTNYPTVAWLSYSNNIIPGFGTGQTTIVGSMSKVATTNTWTGITGAVGLALGWRVKYSDGTYEGAPFAPLYSPSSDWVYNGTGGSGNWRGVRFTWPNNIAGNVIGAYLPISRYNNPSGNLLAKLVTGGTTYDSVALTAGWASGNTGQLVMFSTPVAIQSGADCRLVGADSAADSTSNCYRVLSGLNVDNTAASAAMTFLGARYTYSTNGGASWTDDATKYLPFALLIDSFSAAGGAGFPASSQLGGLLQCA
jgi:hypothetical protein